MTKNTKGTNLVPFVFLAEYACAIDMNSWVKLQLQRCSEHLQINRLL